MFLPKTRLSLSLAALVAAVIMTLLICAPVYAQAEEPPAAPPQNEPALEEPAAESPAFQSSEPAEANPEASPPDAGSPPGGEEPLLEDETPPVTEAVPQEILDEPTEAPPQEGGETPLEAESPAGAEEVPQNSAGDLLGDLALVSEDGEVIPLEAAQEAVDPEVADPWFRSGGVVYNFTSLDCDPRTAGNQACGNPIQAAVNYVRDNRLIPDDLTIHVETGTFNENVSIDGDTAVNANNINLQYVRYLTGAGSDPVTGTVLNGTIDIRNLLYGFTLSGFYIQGNGTEAVPLVRIDSYGVVTVTDVAVVGGGQEGMVITSKTAVATLANVEARDNKNNGVEIGEVVDTETGVNFKSLTGPVSVTNSVFNHNGVANDGTLWRSGLSVATGSIATINGVTASGNLGDGINIFRGVNITVQNSVLLNNSMGDGLWISNLVTGYNTIENVIADGNGSNGMYLIPNGELVLRNVQASSNKRTGVYANTCSPYQDETTGKWLCRYTAPGSVTIYNGVFNDNGNYSPDQKYSGLSVTARGAILAADIEANRNTLDGLYLNNEFYGSPVTLLRTLRGSEASGNGNRGAMIYSLGAVTVQNLVASNNGAQGLFIDSADSYQSVLVHDYSIFAGNGAHGIYIQTKGPITLRYAYAYNNGAGDGQYDNVYLDNQVASALSYASILLYSCDFNGADGNGLYVESDGAITLFNVSANGNALNGAWLVNNTGYSGVSVFPVGLVATNNYNDNGLTGLIITTKGTVYLQGVRAYGNGKSATEQGDGAAINTASGYGGVILLDANFSGNDGYGLRVNAGGAIIWTTGHANSNSNGAGAYLKNDAVLPAAVTLTNVKSESNALDGIQVLSKGFVTIIGELSAANNGGDGYDINNTGGYGVTLVAYTSWSDGNAGYGFQAVSSGAISLTGLSAWNNGLGCRLDNSGGAGGGVTLVNSSCQANTPGSTSLTALSKGVITLVNVDARDNPQGNGVLLDNSSAAYPMGVTVSTGNFWNNKGYGLHIHSKGFVNLLYVATWDNQGDGIYIDNANGYGVSILNNTRQFNGNNQGYGLFIQTNGPVTVNGANFWANLKGSYIENTGGLAGVTLLYSGFDSSDNSPAFFPGLTVNTNGAVYLLKVESGYSADGGVIINNASSSYYAGVTIVSSDFNSTGGTGLTINSRGFITISQITANNNAGDGVRINNISGYGVYIVNTNGFWGDNQGYTAYIESSGAVTVYSIFGGGSRRGIYIDNSYGTAMPVTLFDIYSNPGQAGMTALDVHSKGYITLLNSFILDSQGAGAVLDNAGSPYKYGVTVSGSIFKNNNGYGLSINSLGAVTVINVVSSRNYGVSGYGLYLSSPENIYPVTILNGVFNNNSQDGIYIDVKGIITILNGEANSNGGQGIQAMNDLASGAMPVIITGFRANLNAHHGILVFSKGAITLTSVTSLANGMVSDTAGAYLKSNGSPVYVYYSAFNGNGKQGLHVDTRGGSGAFFNVLNTYAGNDVAGGTKDVNLLWEH
ncbi:MAG: hypothetical protein HPY59_08705 [Anaerolineae bacterium]|nr:hypothetical protein [Anaerolineae bacterium]